MAGNSRDEETKPCISEQYLGAVGSSSLRVAEHGSMQGSIIAAAGMNKHRLGLALRRLMAEWDRAAKPKHLTDEQVDALAKSLKTEPAELRFAIQMTEDQRREAIAKHGLDPRNFVSVAVVEAPNPRVGLVEYQDGERTVYLRPSEAAERDAGRWYANELALLLLGLRTLPAVRDALVAQDGDVHIVAKVLQWWLDPRCPDCQGRRQRVIAGTGRMGSKNCGTCHGTGTSDVPHGWRGAKLLAHMKASLTAAARDLSEGTFKHQRSHRNEADRLAQRLRGEGRPVLALPPKIPGRRYSPAGRYHDGEHVTRTGDDVYHVTEMDRDGLCAVFVCIVAPADGSRAVGDADLNLCRRYMRVEYDAASDMKGHDHG